MQKKVLSQHKRNLGHGYVTTKEKIKCQEPWDCHAVAIKIKTIAAKSRNTL